MLIPIVGAFFRPPAKAILEVLPSGAPLRIIPEPDNEHDPNALKVVVSTEDIPSEQHEALDAGSAAYGFTLEAILEQREWHLGYIPRTIAATLAPTLNGQIAHGTLAFTAKGTPAVELKNNV